MKVLVNLFIRSGIRNYHNDIKYHMTLNEKLSILIHHTTNLLEGIFTKSTIFMAFIVTAHFELPVWCPNTYRGGYSRNWPPIGWLLIHPNLSSLD
jgi:hypothetical protein